MTLALDFSRARRYLQAGNLRSLFTEELGWNKFAAEHVVVAGGRRYQATGVAEKKGMQVFLCQPEDKGSPFPPYADRVLIDRQISKIAHEHLVVYVGRPDRTQVWQWVRRERGHPNAPREVRYNPDQHGEVLLQKLERISVSLEEEEDIGIVEITSRVRAAFDVERVTKRFYDAFRAQHEAFLKFVKGITETADREWYASLMLNRLMFVYFIQKKGFLDDDRNYLQNRLKRLQAERGRDKFFSFYRHFLLRLFHEGLGSNKRTPELDKLIGKVPYLNGGLFLPHQLEEKYAIEIPDDAFERVFAFFDQYQWHLDERPNRDDREINPDVLGYIFEKYINQKQMGAYYTKEDISDFMTRPAVVGYLLDQLRREYSPAFDEKSELWEHLQRQPARYIPPALLHGIELTLPTSITAGGDPQVLNKEADSSLALPKETWREVLERRERVTLLLRELEEGKVNDVDAAIERNLDMLTLLEDCLRETSDSKAVGALWRRLEGLSVLDPTCGSGAFLFAALAILDRLYGAALETMERLVGTHALESSDRALFGVILKEVEAHPNRRYFILKSIMVNNLYGVDIMEEAVEICKLRFFLKLAAQLEDPDHVEPLPDIDFNIRAGNTLVGYATIETVRSTLRRMVGLDESQVEAIERRAKEADEAFRAFRKLQVTRDTALGDLLAQKKLLKDRLSQLREELDKYLASEYGRSQKTYYSGWRSSHLPFHWFAEFYEIISRGGFDVVIGNPPYVEYPKVKGTYEVRGFATAESVNLYAYVFERSLTLLQSGGRIALIVPIAITSVGENTALRRLLLKTISPLYLSHYAIRPAKLFTGVEQRLSIVSGKRDSERPRRVLTTKYHQWFTDERATLFERLRYTEVTNLANERNFPKVPNRDAREVLETIESTRGARVKNWLVKSSKAKLLFHRTPGYWIRCMDFKPYFKSPQGDKSIHHIRELHFGDKTKANFVGSIVSSTLYFYWFFSRGNCRNLTIEDVTEFQVGIPSNENFEELDRLFPALMADYKKNSTVKTRGEAEYQEFDWAASKPLIDEIDRVLARHYGLTPRQTDFVINYDIKYRSIGGDDEDQE